MGSRSNPIEAIYNATINSIKDRFKSIPKNIDISLKPNQKNLLKLLDDLTLLLGKSNDGIMLIVDEMGKFLNMQLMKMVIFLFFKN